MDILLYDLEKTFKAKEKQRERENRKAIRESQRNQRNNHGVLAGLVLGPIPGLQLLKQQQQPFITEDELRLLVPDLYAKLTKTKTTSRFDDQHYHQYDLLNPNYKFIKRTVVKQHVRSNK